jgi:CRISPR-associated exonuclease Cas4
VIGMVIGGMVVVVVAITLLLFLAPSRPTGQGSYADSERRYMPEEIARGRLVLSEQLLRTRAPAKIVAKPDQVYLTPAGLLVPVETKTRALDRVYEGDQVELSVQAFALRHGRVAQLGRYQVASYGYVRIKRQGHPPSYHRVQLHSDEQVVAMRQRRLDLEQGRVQPAGPASPRICPKCAKRATCPRMAA